jgi:hypothetical protein
MMTRADIMIHSSYDNLSLMCPAGESTTSTTYSVFDDLQGRGYLSR